MLTPQRIQELADPIESVYIAMTNELLANIGRHITKPNWTHTAAWEIQKLSELGQLTAENAAIINKWIEQLPEEIRETMEETRRQALEDIEKQLAKAAKKGYVTPPERDSTVDILREYSQQAADKLNLVNTTMLQSSVEQYQRTVMLTQQEAERLEAQRAATQTALNEAAGNVAVGTETRRQAMQRAIRRIADEGLTGFYDRAGRSWSPEAYVNMDIRTTVHNVAIQSVKNRMQDYNTQVFQVSAHAGARPLCYPYQGKFYSWDNTSGEIPTGNGDLIQYEPLSSTTYGQAAGLFGINCGHRPIPIIPGVSIPHAQDYVQPQEENDKAYAESQRQRALEREIRAAKRVVEMGDDSKEAKDAVKAAQERMRKFIAETGRTRRYDRESLYGGKKAPTPPADKRPPRTPQNVAPQATTPEPAVDKITIPTFTPANTREEAEAFAGNFAKTVSYKGMALENCNEVNRALNTLTTKYPIKQLDKIMQNARMKAEARACFAELEINGKKIASGEKDREAFLLNQSAYRATINAIRSRYPNGVIPPDMQRKINVYEQKLRYTRWSVADAYGPAGIITHEYGHIIADQYYAMINYALANRGYLDTQLGGPGLKMREVQKQLGDVYRKAKENGDIYLLSQYAATDKDEFFAEAFCALEHGEKLPDYITEVVEVVRSGPPV